MGSFLLLRKECRSNRNLLNPSQVNKRKKKKKREKVERRETDKEKREETKRKKEHDTLSSVAYPVITWKKKKHLYLNSCWMIFYKK